jgi:hypothetical protein
MWRIWRAPNNASKWQMGFNLAFKELKTRKSTIRIAKGYCLLECDVG